MTDTGADTDPNRTRLITRRLCVWLLYGLNAFWGFAQVVSPNSGLIYIISALLFASAATSWALLDSRINKRPMPSSIPLLYFLLWPIASLGYLIWTRGWRGLGLWMVHVVGLTTTLTVTYFLTALILLWARVIELAPDGSILTAE